MHRKAVKKHNYVVMYIRQTQTLHEKRPFHARVAKHTDIPFSNTEISLLQKGPKYNTHAKRRNWI
jgi:hypothetical protein